VQCQSALVLYKAESFKVPAIIAEVGPEATKRFFEFFIVPIRNKNTRMMYYHSFKATGIKNYLENGGTLEVARRIAGHADSRRTKLFDRRGQKVLLEDIERIRY
jgi:hypothetical protein